VPVEDILRRIETLEARGTVEREPEVSTVLGGEETPIFRVSSIVDEFERIVATSLVLKSERQRKKWRVPKDTALARFIDVIGGDRPINAQTRTDTLAFRSFWQERIVSGEVEIDTANKSIGRISSMYRTINENRQLGLPAIFENLRIGGGKDKQRMAFAPEFVQERILADGMFADLNTEARRVIYLSETGLRLTEACNLSRTTIRLNAPVPHVQIRPEGREIETDQSQRDIPLVGAALMAMREQPDGFPRYRDKADSLSALVNQALEARGASAPSRSDAIYSLRHTFEDRLTAVEAPERSWPPSWVTSGTGPVTDWAPHLSRSANGSIAFRSGHPWLCRFRVFASRARSDRSGALSQVPFPLAGCGRRDNDEISLSW
jgi:integrase